MCETSNITKYNILGMLNEPFTLNSLMEIAYMIGQHTATSGERECWMYIRYLVLFEDIGDLNKILSQPKIKDVVEKIIKELRKYCFL